MEVYTKFNGKPGYEPLDTMNTCNIIAGDWEIVNEKAQDNVKKSHNVADNVAQRNSQDLTEQWKKGKIEKAKYWVKYRNGNIDIWELSEGIPIESKPEIIEVLAPVPSFEEYNKLQNSLEHEKVRATHYYKTLTEIEDENEKLEELLKECKKTFFEIRLSLSSGKINSVFDLSYQRENDIKEVLK